MLWPQSVVLVANTNGRLAILALAGLLVHITFAFDAPVLGRSPSEYCHPVWCGKLEW